MGTTASHEEVTRMVMEYLRQHPQAVTTLSGALWFSEKEWRLLRNQGHDRTYGELAGGQIVEYTEMVTFDALAENPEDICGFDDAKFLGMGAFHHWEEYRG